MTTFSDAKTSATRWTALDGLRGIMAIFVFLAHVDYDLFPGPIIFMDTFFILSSFLITRLLLKDWQEHGHINFAKFYIRRAKRLFPALLLVVIATTTVTYFYFGQGADRMLHVLGALFYFSNWLRALEIPHEGVLGHTWSLSIEEQYYLVWPVMLAFFLRQHWKEKKLMLTLLGIIIFSMAWRAYLSLHGASIHRTYNGTDVRLDSLAIGAILALNFNALWLQKWLKFFSNANVIWLLILTLAVGIFTVDYRVSSWYVWQQSCYQLISLALIMGLLQSPEDFGLKVFFQNPIIVYLGTVCYGIYLWHYPLLIVGVEVFQLNNWDKVLFCGAATIIFATISYFLVERPVLRAK
jgi:peptidoglycan/LPS O-acetylase OafA/YrhL